MDFIKRWVLKQPLFICIIALIIVFCAFLLPEFYDFMLGGSILLGAKFFVSLAFGLIGVKVVKFAIAFFAGGTDEQVDKDPIANAIVCGAVYLSVFMLLSAIILTIGQ